jgi:predicted nucleotidyltransferase
MADSPGVPSGLDIEPRHWAIVRSILKQHLPGREVWAFGSRVKGTAKPYSDLDLAVLGNEPMGLALQAQLAEAFDESDLPWRVDVLDWATTSESFRALIAQCKVELQKASASGMAP